MTSLPLVDGVEKNLAAEAADRLREFRDQLYRCLGRRADELFELTDAVLCADGPVHTLVGLCLTPEHHRAQLGTGRPEIRRCWWCAMPATTFTGWPDCWPICRCS